MKITKKVKPVKIPQKRGRKPKLAYRYINEADQISYIDKINDTLNNPQNFTYMDYNRNRNMIQVIRKHYEQMIKMYGIDLTYFRKFNTFFLQGEQNHANMTYGEDTTAIYYGSGYVRAFLDISTYNWLFNSMGYETQQNINLYIGIEDFRSRFATLFGKVKKQNFVIPVHGNSQFNELTGIIDVPEFYATIYGQYDDDLNAYNIYPEIKERPLNSSFYKSNTHKTTLYPITGVLSGKMIPDEEYPLITSGLLSGILSYHSFENIQNSPAWQIVPQVGDYFNMRIGQMEQEYQITQVFDRILQNNGGINALMGKYIFQIQAVRRSPSHQEFEDITNTEKQTSEEDILQELNSSVRNPIEQEQPILSDTVKQNKKCKENKANKTSNKIAQGIYGVQDDQDDYVYGGYQTHLKD